MGCRPLPQPSALSPVFIPHGILALITVLLCRITSMIRSLFRTALFGMAMISFMGAALALLTPPLHDAGRIGSVSLGDLLAQLSPLEHAAIEATNAPTARENGSQERLVNWLMLQPGVVVLSLTGMFLLILRPTPSRRRGFGLRHRDESRQYGTSSWG